MKCLDRPAVRTRDWRDDEKDTSYKDNKIDDMGKQSILSISTMVEQLSKCLTRFKRRWGLRDFEFDKGYGCGCRVSLYTT
jgi:hypothetical protein